MAGLFGLFDYSKEGPGISKDAPKKKTIFVFFETFFRNFWKFMPISLVYSLMNLPQLTSGLAAAGYTNVARNTARDKHSFGLSDFFDTIKKNWKQALPVGIINTIVFALLIFDIYFFYVYNIGSGTVSTICMAFAFCILFVFTVMQFYIPTLLITFKFKLSQIYKNAYKFVFINLKNNFICIISLILVNALYFLIAYLLQSYWYLVIPIEIMIHAITYPSFKFLLIQYCVFPSIKKCIIDPYYRDHPNEDIEKRRDLGLEIEEEEKNNTED